MNLSTIHFGGAIKTTALALVVLGTSMGVNAAAWKFKYNGIEYKTDAKNTYAIVDHPTAKPNQGTDKTAIGDYTGTIEIPTEVECNGKKLPVTQVGDAFYDTSVEHVILPDGVKINGQGLFSGCKNLKSVRMPADYDFGKGAEFEGCIALEEFTVPAGATTLANNNFKNCISLRKLIFAESETPIAVSASAFTVTMKDGEGEEAQLLNIPLTEVEIYRPIDLKKYTAMADKPFRNHKVLQKVTVGGKCTELPASYFFGASALTEVVLADEFETFGTNCFEGTPLTEITIPAAMTNIASSCFQNCKQLKKVNLSAGVTSISDMAFYKSGVEEINLPEGLKTIGQMAFSSSKIAGELVLPSTVTSVGIQAYANCPLTALNLPASLSRIGDGAFMGCDGIAKVEVAADNAAFASDATNTYIASKDGAELKYVAPASAATAIEGAFTSVAPYALYNAVHVEAVNLPSCVKYGDYCFYGSGLKNLSLNGEIGRYVAAQCKQLTKLSIDASSVPMAVAEGDVALNEVVLRPRTSTIQQEAFKDCAALKSLDLGLTLSILETDCFKGAGINALTVCAANPAAMSEGVFTAASDINVTVPVDLVDKYKAADGWKYINIAGDANLATGPADMGMPHGLYYAGTDNMLHCVYADGETDTYDVGGIPHTFQLLEYSDRIYGACAGVKFVYSATGSVDGDGKLFYISKIGGDIFQATVLDNAGGNAYADPFGLYEHQGILYVNDRNVSLRKIPASALALPQNYPSWVENNWLGYYGDPWSWGCIKAGFNITVDPEDGENIYWVGMKYNGNGLYCFKDKDIYTNASPVTKPESGRYFEGLAPIFTTFQIDKKNNHLYIYIEKAGSGTDDNLSGYVKGGLYRINIDDLKANPNPSMFSALNPVLIDGSPVKYEGAGTNEHIAISQLAIDENGEYMYWCYRAPSASEAATNEAQDFNTQAGGKYWWADAYDASNPLHHSGIKRIKLGEEKPEVEMVVPGVEGYGIAPVKYEGSSKTDGVHTVVVENSGNLSVAGDVITVAEDSKVGVYNLNGVMVLYTSVAAGESISIAELPAGAYVVAATAANGKTTSVKVVK